MIAVQHGRGGDGLHVGTGTRFGDAVCRNLAFTNPTQEFFLLLFRASVNQGVASQHRHASNRGETGVASSKFLVDDDLIQKTQAHASVGFRYGAIQQTEFTGLVDGLLGKNAVSVPLLGVGYQFLIGEFSGQIRQHLLVLCQIKVNHELRRFTAIIKRVDGAFSYSRKISVLRNVSPGSDGCRSLQRHRGVPVVFQIVQQPEQACPDGF